MPALRGDNSAYAEPSCRSVCVVGFLTAADVTYIRSNFVGLETLVTGRGERPEDVRALISERRLPRPSYVLDDGTEMFPRDYFRLLDETSGVDGLRKAFLARFRRAAERHADREAETAWRAYLDGTYGVCLREVTPEAIARKSQLVSALCELMMLAEPSDSGWRQALRATVDELDGLEREFAPDFDRDPARGRRPTRDLLINAARDAYPDIFDDGRRRGKTGEEVP